MEIRNSRVLWVLENKKLLKLEVFDIFLSERQNEYQTPN